MRLALTIRSDVASLPAGTLHESVDGVKDELGAGEVDEVAGAVGDGDATAGRQPVEGSAPRRLDRGGLLIRQARIATAGDHDLEGQAVDRGVGEFLGRAGPVDALDRLDEAEGGVHVGQPVVAEILGRRGDLGAEQIGVECVVEHDAGDVVAVAVGEDADVHAAERVTDQDVRWTLSDRREECRQVIGHIDGGAVRARVGLASAATGAVVDTGTSRRGRLREDDAPASGIAPGACLEDDGRRAGTTAIDVKGAPTDLDGGSVGDVGCDPAVAREPERRRPRTNDIEPDADDDARDDGEGDGPRADAQGQPPR